VPLCDILEIMPAEKDAFVFTGNKLNCETEKNLCYVALKKMREAYNFPAVKICLHKIIPDGSGLGGGSSDAAFLIKTINQIFHLNIPAEKMIGLAAVAGSDCAFFLENRPALASGKGDIIRPIPLTLKGYFLVIIVPGLRISTADAYRLITPALAGFDLNKLPEIPPEEWKNYLTNDFEEAVQPLYPDLNMYKETMYQKNALYASMSGSGSAVFGLFEKPVYLKNDYPDCFYWSGILD
jgi:4-diphosphocytidyl-2-C-methyl-D-erythritol kinase